MSTSSQISLKITALDGPLGAQVDAFNAVDARADDVLALKAALREHLIVVLKKQTLTDGQFLDFATRFGAVFTPPRDAPVLGSGKDGVQPDIVIVSNVAEDGVLGNRELTAHTDHQWVPVPSSGSLLYALEVPPVGGDTSFVNTVAAYDALDDATKREIDDLRLITYNPFLRQRSPLPGGAPLYRTSDIEATRPFIDHPLVRTHPESGKRALFLGEATEVEIVSYAPDRGAALIARLRAHLADPRFRYVHRWSAGDIVYWDNQVTLHARSGFPGEQRRLMKRISLAGSRPF